MLVNLQIPRIAHRIPFLIYAFGSLILCILLTLNSSTLIQTRDSPTMTTIHNKEVFPETFFISHGSPTLAIDDSLLARRFLQSFRQTVLPEKPKAILIISGHWETSDPAVTASPGPYRTIYDFYGFPEEMYRIKYPAPGSPRLAERVRELLNESGFETVHVDKKRGLDHGAWVPLMLMYPEADIPVCQLSVQTHRDAAHHFRVGHALKALKDDGVMIVGSGATTHNLRMIDPRAGDRAAPWAEEFDRWLREALVDGRYGDVNDYARRAPHAKVAHPRPDHFYPLHVAMGAAGEGTKGEMIHHSWGLGTLSYASYKFAA